MDFTPMEPILSIDWEKVSVVRVTLEKPHRGGGLRWRQGTSDAKKNLSFNANDPNSGPPFWPGAPIMYPDDAPAKVGDSFTMPITQAFVAFGYFYAPKEVPKNGLMGFTMSGERERVAAFWNGYKMPPGDGTMHPPMNRLGPPHVPAVAIRPLDKNFQPMTIGGEEVVIRPREFFDFDNANHYEGTETARETDELATQLQGFTREEIEGLRELVKAKASRGKS